VVFLNLVVACNLLLLTDLFGLAECYYFVSESIAVKYITDNFPQAQWTHAYTDGSAKKATENGGGGVYIQLIHKVHTIAVATGKYFNNDKAEAAAFSSSPRCKSPQGTHIRREGQSGDLHRRPVSGDSPKESSPNRPG
jgi:hypothetical protein